MVVQLKLYYDVLTEALRRFNCVRFLWILAGTTRGLGLVSDPINSRNLISRAVKPASLSKSNRRIIDFRDFRRRFSVKY